MRKTAKTAKPEVLEFALVPTRKQRLWKLYSQVATSTFAAICLLFLGLHIYGTYSAEAYAREAQRRAEEKARDQKIAAAVERDFRCFSLALFWEGKRGKAGDEVALKDKVAIGQNILNRVESGLYANTVCGVIYEVRIDAETGKKVAMYSFTQDNRPDPAVAYPNEQDWQISKGVAYSMLDDWYRNGRGFQYYKELRTAVKDSLNYHAPYVSPPWSKDDLRECKLARIKVAGLFHLHYGQAKAVNVEAHRQCRSELLAARAIKAAKAKMAKAAAEKPKPKQMASR